MKPTPIVLTALLAALPASYAEAERRAETDRFVIVAVSPSVSGEASR